MSTCCFLGRKTRLTLLEALTRGKSPIVDFHETENAISQDQTPSIAKLHAELSRHQYGTAAGKLAIACLHSLTSTSRILVTSVDQEPVFATSRGTVVLFAR